MITDDCLLNLASALIVLPRLLHIDHFLICFVQVSYKLGLLPNIHHCLAKMAGNNRFYLSIFNNPLLLFPLNDNDSCMRSQCGEKRGELSNGRKHIGWARFPSTSSRVRPGILGPDVEFRFADNSLARRKQLFRRGQEGRKPLIVDDYNDESVKQHVSIWRWNLCSIIGVKQEICSGDVV